MRRWLLLFDLLAVIAFVAIGRDTHDGATTIAGITETAAPFLVGVVVGWGVARAWTAPVSTTTGVVVAAVTVSVGMVLRRVVFDEGTAATFVIVAAVFLGAVQVGWRFLGRRVGSAAR